MRTSGKLLVLLLVLCCANVTRANERAYGFCTQGAQPIIVVGLNGAPQAHSSYPGCTVTVFISGTVTLATIFKDNLGTALGNPFTGDLTTGYWQFYAANGRYDVLLTGAGIPNPGFTFGDILLADLGSSGGLPGGVPIQTQVNNGGVFGGTPCENFGNITAGPENVDCDWHPKGPNPYVDITRFGARTCSVLTAPCIGGITASINSGTPTATLSSASTFIKGDGVVIYGAGAPTTLTVPTGLAVTNVLAQMGTGTGLTVPGASGSTTRCYKIIARTTGGGYTAASPETCTTTGQAALGAVGVNLSSCTRSAITVTCTTSSAHPVLVNFGAGFSAEVYIGGSISDNSFRGWRSVLSAVDSTHFTFQDTAVNTGNGATTSSTGGTATFFAANHLTWTAVTNTWLYYIYGGAPGAETLIGVGRPQGIGLVDTTWEDFGSLMANYVFPPWIPTTPPTVGANDNLSTTILSGAGTTTLTLAANAGATVSGVGIRLDASPGIVAAAASVSSVGVLYIPADPSGNAFVVNNFCDLRPYRLTVKQNGNLALFETVAIGGSAGARWSGLESTANPGASGGQWGGLPSIATNYAQPGLYVAASGAKVDGVSFVPGNTAQNGGLSMLVDAAGGFSAEFFNDNFQPGSNSNDLMGFGLILRGATDVTMDLIAMANGSTVDGASHNSPFYCNQCDSITIKRMFNVGRGIIWNPSPSGGATLSIDANHYLGGGSPFVSSAGGKVILGAIEMDTVGHPCVSAFNVLVVTKVYNNTGCGPSGTTFQSPSVTGQVAFATGVPASVPGSVVFDNSLSQSITSANSFINGVPQLVSIQSGPGALSTDYNSASIFVQGPPPAAPTCVVSAGGSLLLNTYFFEIQPVWWNNVEGNVSPASTGCTTTTGNQTITINWTTVSGNPKGYNVFAFLSGTGAGLISSPVPLPPSQTSFVWTVGGGGGNAGINSVPLAAPTMLLPGSQGIGTPQVQLSSTGGFATSISTPTLTANRNVMWPDTTGTPELFPASGANPNLQTVNANTTSAQTIMSFAFPSGALNTLGKTFRVWTEGNFTPVNTTETFTFSESTLGLPNNNGYVPPNTSVHQYSLLMECTTVTTGVNGNLRCSWTYNVGDAPASGNPTSAVYQNSQLTGGIVNLTGVVTLNFTVAFTTASTTNAGVQAHLVVEQLN